MDKYEDSGRLRLAVSAGHSLAVLALLMALGFFAYFAVGVSMPELPLPVQQAIAFLPS